MAGGSKSAMGHWKINCRSLQLVSKSAKPDVTFALWPFKKGDPASVLYFKSTAQVL
jgi:hypothetical protein